MSAKQKIEPVDKSRCQGERNKVNVFTLGGGTVNDPKNRIRCKNKPAWAAYEIKPDPDGLRGRMSMCQACRDQFERQSPPIVVKNIHYRRIHAVKKKR